MNRRKIEKLEKIEEINILLKYLYLNEENYVTFNNGMTDIRLTMNEDGNLLSVINNDPDDFPTVRRIYIPEILGIIEQLKEQDYNEKDSVWDRIKVYVSMNMSLNLNKVR